MRERLRFDDLIVVLPGIGGSVLRSADGPVWEPSLGMAGALLMKRPQVLERLAGEREKLDDPARDDGVVATGLIRTPVTIPGLAAANQYQRLTDALNSEFDLIKGDPRVDGPPTNYFEFAYDWRRDNRVSAARLKELVDRELPKWQSTLPYGTARTVLVCHSMGGLVAKYYLDALDGWRDCRALITFGTPFRGSPKSLNLLANGFTKYGVELRAVSSLIRGFTSVYQLLPRYPVVQDQSGQLLRVHELGADVGGLDVGRARDAYQDFHGALGTPEPYQRLLRPLVGYGHRTAQSAVVSGATLKINEQIISANAAQRSLSTGDGTVPAVSALPIELSETGPWWWHNGKHSSMHTKQDTLNSLVKTLTLLSSDLGDLQRPDDVAEKGATIPEGPTLDLHVDEVQLAGEPVIVDCILDDPTVTEPPRLTAPENVTVQRTETSDGYRFALHRVPEGAHEVTVDWAGRSVTDVFEVC